MKNSSRKSRKMLAALLSVLLFILCGASPVAADGGDAVPISVDAPESVEASLSLDCKSCVLIEMTTKTVLYESNADEALRPASVTKIMTVLLVMEAVKSGKASMDDIVSVSENAASMGGSQVYLEAGEQMSLRELLKCVVVASANDASVALAEFISGSEEAFVARMNERAVQLGMENTHFVNTNGLDDAPDSESHLTSARDIAIMSSELMQNHPEITEFTTVWMDSIRNGAFGLTNTNRLIRFYRGATGLKTGSTSKAGFCISATAERDGMSLCAVIMGAPTRDERNEAAKALLDYGYANYAVYSDPATECDPAAVLGGVSEQIKTGHDGFTVVLKKGSEKNVSVTRTLNPELAAPVVKGDAVGSVTYFAGDEIIGEIPILASESVEKIGYTDVIFKIICGILGK